MPNLIWQPSKGFGSRCGYGVDFIILHYTWGRKTSDLATLCSKRASSHFYIPVNGDLYWLVRLENRAFHAGIEWRSPSTWQYKRWRAIRPNERSIGIEIEGFGEYTEEQYRALEWLLPLLLERFDIPLRFLPDPYRGMQGRDAYEIEKLTNFWGILGHGNIHFSKVDPGMNFDWDRMKCLELLPDPGCLTFAENVVYRGDPSLLPERVTSYEFNVAN